jgi:hypothetical protein
VLFSLRPLPSLLEFARRLNRIHERAVGPVPYPSARGQPAQNNPCRTALSPPEGILHASGDFPIGLGRVGFIGLSVIQRFKVLCDRSQIGIGCEDLEIVATNSFSSPLAHFGYRLASDKAAEFRTEATVPADD